jgi:hypothetical protein
MRFLMFILTLIVWGCIPVVTIDEQIVSKQLQFIQNGQTSASEITSLFGEPNYKYENGQIIIYSMCPGKNGQLQQIKRGKCGADETHEGQLVGMYREESLDKVLAIYNLVIVFDTEGVLSEHRLLRIR